MADADDGMDRATIERNYGNGTAGQLSAGASAPRNRGKQRL